MQTFTQDIEATNVTEQQPKVSNLRYSSADWLQKITSTKHH